MALSGIPAWDYHGGGGSILKLADAKAASLLNITGANGATIDGLSLVGGRLGKEIHGILLDKPDPGKHEDAFRIERCQVNGFTGDGVRLGTRLVLFHPPVDDRLLPRRWCALRRLGGFLMDNWFSGNSGAGFGGRDCAALTLTGNRIEWNGEAGILVAAGSHCNITGNYLDRSGKAGIHLGRYRRAGR